MIGRVACRVFNHPHPNLADVLSTPEGHAGLTCMLGTSNLRPIVVDRENPVIFMDRV